VEDWAEVQRLFHREGLTRKAIARRLGMSRTTVIRLLALSGPPRYARTRAGSQLDPYRDEIAALLAADPTVAATVIRKRLQRSGYQGGITILKDHLAAVRPGFLAARAFQRTSYLRARSSSSTGGTPGSRSRSARARRARRSASSRACPTREPTPSCSASGSRWPTS
jgi:transcriptional regulator with XRE-family HTH domain